MLIAPTIGKTGKLVGRVGLIGGIAESIYNVGHDGCVGWGDALALSVTGASVTGVGSWIGAGYMVADCAWEWICPAKLEHLYYYGIFWLFFYCIILEKKI